LSIILRLVGQVYMRSCIGCCSCRHHCPAFSSECRDHGHRHHHQGHAISLEMHAWEAGVLSSQGRCLNCLCAPSTPTPAAGPLVTALCQAPPPPPPASPSFLVMTAGNDAQPSLPLMLGGAEPCGAVQLSALVQEAAQGGEPVCSRDTLVPKPALQRCTTSP
jgi:hypothetical protein